MYFVYISIMIRGYFPLSVCEFLLSSLKIEKLVNEWKRDVSFHGNTPIEYKCAKLSYVLPR